MKGQIPRSFIDDLLANADITDVIAKKINLKKAGRNYQACCPFHHEKTPSFTVSQSKQFYHCFGCGVHGNVISFLMEYERLDFVEAIENLANMQNLVVPYKQYKNSKLPDETMSNTQDLYQLMQNINLFYQQQLKKSSNARHYLSTRQISSNIIEKYEIGYAPDSFNAILTNFGKEKLQKKSLDQIGVLSKSEKNTEYDKFRNRIMFPIINKRGKVIGFGGRVLDNSKPKYLNSPETKIFHKGREVYGLYQLLKIANANNVDNIIIVEGYMDVVALSEHGVNNSVATLGTASTKEQIELIFKSTDNIIFCYDGDRAGKEAANRVLDNLLPLLYDGRQVRFAFLPDGEDPDSFISKYGLNEFNALISNSELLSDFLFKTCLSTIDLSTHEGKAKLSSIIIPKIENVPGATLKIYLKNMLGSKLGIIEPSQLEEIFNQYSKQQQNNINVKAVDHNLSVHKNIQQMKKTPMRVIIALLLQNPKLINFIQELDIEVMKNADEPGFDILYQLIELCNKNVGSNTGLLVEYWRDKAEFEIIQKLASWEQIIEDDEKIENEFFEKLNILYDDLINKKIIKLIEKDRKNLLSQEEKLDLSKLLRQQKLKSI